MGEEIDIQSKEEDVMISKEERENLDYHHQYHLCSMPDRLILPSPDL